MSQTVSLSNGIELYFGPISVERAQELLDQNDSNRRLSDEAVNVLSRQMSHGEWYFAGDPVRVSKTGRLLDGQHRLESIVRTGKPQELIVLSGFDDAVQAVIDSGRRRSAADALRMSDVPNSNVAAGTARLLMAWSRGVITKATPGVGNVEVLNFVNDNREALDRAVSTGVRVRANKVMISATVVGAAYFRIAQVGAPEMVESFFDKLASGLELSAGEPVNALRNMIARRDSDKRKMTRDEALYYVIRAWNGTVRGEHMAKLQLPRNGVQPTTFPRPIGNVEDSDVPEYVSDTPGVDAPVSSQDDAHEMNEVA